MPVRTNVRDRETQEKINDYNRMMLNRPIPVSLCVTYDRQLFN